jgi:polyribonucleotide nucleotidyltransferase
MARAIKEIDGLCGGGSGPGGGGGGGEPIELNKTYTGRVTGIKDFGCFVECTPGKEGLCHISELSEQRVRRTEDVVKMGEMITVKCIGIDERSGKVRLSRKAAMRDQEGQAAPAPAAQ